MGAGAVPDVYAVSHAASLGKAVEHEHQVALCYAVVGNLPLFRYSARKEEFIGTLVNNLEMKLTLSKLYTMIPGYGR